MHFETQCASNWLSLSLKKYEKIEKKNTAFYSILIHSYFELLEIHKLSAPDGKRMCGREKSEADNSLCGYFLTYLAC